MGAEEAGTRAVKAQVLMPAALTRLTTPLPAALLTDHPHPRISPTNTLTSTT